MSKITVLYLHETSQLGGAENSLLQLVDGLDRTKYEPVFICPGEGAFADALDERRVKLYPYDFPPVRMVVGVPRTLAVIREVMRTHNVGLIHAQSIRTDVYASLTARKTKLPVVWHLRNMMTDTDLFDPERFLSFMPNAIICNSAAIAQRLVRGNRLPAKVRVVYNGVDTTVFHPALSGTKVREEFGITEDEVVVGMASRFNRIKGHETFFEAVRLLCTSVHNPAANVRFFIAGGAVFERDKARETEIQKIIARLPGRERIILSGFRSDMPEVYAAMDMLVLASQTEACGRVLIEAMACGKPVIATSSGGTPEIVEDGISGFLFSPDDAPALAAKISLLVGQRNLSRRMGEAGRCRVLERFSRLHNVRKIEAVYEEILAS